MQEGYNEENECRTVQENFYVGSLEVGEETPQHFWSFIVLMITTG